jgi:hypothetical protein
VISPLLRREDMASKDDEHEPEMICGVRVHRVSSKTEQAELISKLAGSASEVTFLGTEEKDFDGLSAELKKRGVSSVRVGLDGQVEHRFATGRGLWQRIKDQLLKK